MVDMSVNKKLQPYSQQMLRFVFFIALVTSASNIAYAKQQQLELSGFARLIGGYVDDDGLNLRGYENTIDFDKDSLIALRADYQFNRQINVVGQAIAHSADNRESGLQWLYLQYTPLRNLSLKLGKQRLPIFAYSDIIDVGFAYPYITPPLTTYTDIIFTEFEGVLGRYDYGSKNYRGFLELYGGFNNSIVDIDGREVEVDLDSIFGAVGSLSIGDISFRVGYITSKTTFIENQLNGLEDVLTTLGFGQSARAVQAENRFEFFQFGFNYEKLEYFISGEHNEIISNAYLVPDYRSTYVSIGKYDYPFTYHFTAGYGKTDIPEPINELQFGIDPVQDFLTASFNELERSVQIDTRHFYTLGVRYDYSSSIAIKLEATHVNDAEDTRLFVMTNTATQGNNTATLYQFGIEWVF